MTEPQSNQYALAYLLNSYPMTSTTFIRREIEALERRGLRIKRYAGRRWPVALVDPLDIAEHHQTEYLLEGNFAGLVGALAREVVVNLAGLARGLWQACMLVRRAGGEAVKHAAYLMQAVSLRQKSRRDGIRHIHVHFSTNAAAIALLCRKMGGPSYSFTAHGPDEFDEAARHSLDAKLDHAAFAVAISHFCKSQMIRFSRPADADKIHVVHCGLDLADFEPCTEFSADNQTFVCVGRLCPQKAQAMIPAAVAALARDFPNLRVVLIGDGESRADIGAAITAHGVADRIELRGWMPNAAIRDLLRDSRALLLPSFAEGLPVVIMEAFALGRPVLSTYVAGIPELVDERCGWMVPAGAPEALVSALRAALLATPGDLARLGAEGRARVERDHDIDRIAAELQGLFVAAQTQFGNATAPSTTQVRLSAEGPTHG